jgi:hypothetical protein
MKDLQTVSFRTIDYKNQARGSVRGTHRAADCGMRRKMAYLYSRYIMMEYLHAVSIRTMDHEDQSRGSIERDT